MSTLKSSKDYLEILRNSYFKKTVGYFFSNLKPKYENIEYNIKNGDNLVSILNSFLVDENDIQKIVRLLNEADVKSLNQNLTLKLTLENTKI